MRAVAPAETADALLTEFGSLGATLAGSRNRQLRAAPREREALDRLRGLRSVIITLLRDRLAERPLLTNWRALLDYLKVEFGHWPMERCRVLHLDSRNHLIRDELVSIGSIDEAAIYVEAVLRRAIELGSAGLIIVHNHPSGIPTPSRTDVAFTKSLIAAARPIGIAIHDHLIIGGGRHASMRSLGLL